MRIQKEIENVERVKDKIATMPLTMEDAIEFHKQVVDKIEKERKEINKELDLDDDIEEKGFTGASKEPKKVSTPELKKMKLSESLFKSLNEDLQDDLINDVYNKLGDLAFEYYEEKNENPTKEEWQKALDWFMEKFFDESNYLDYELEDDEFDESLNENPDQEIRKIIQILKDDESEDAYGEAIVDMDNRFERYFGEDNYYNRYDGKPLKALTYYPLKQAEVLLRKLKRIAKKYNIKLDESLNEGIESVSIPAPYDKYFKLEDEDQLEEYGWTKGEQIPNYDCHILAVLYPKDDEIDVYPILTDDPDYPVCELAGARLYPVKIQRRWKKLIKDESLEKDESPFGLNDSVDESLLTNDEYDYFTAYEVHNNYSKLYYEYPTYEEAKKDCLDGIKAAKDLGIKDIDKYTIYGVNQYGGDEFEETLVDTLYLDESLNEDWDDLIDDIDREDREKKQAEATQHMIDQQEKEVKEEERKAKEEAKRKERIGDAAWDEKDWIAERKKGDLDFSNYSDEEKAEIEKRLKAFDDNKTAQAQYQRKKEAEERKKAEEERKKAEQKKEEKIKQGIDTFGKVAKAPGELLKAAKKGLNIK